MFNLKSDKKLIKTYLFFKLVVHYANSFVKNCVNVVLHNCLLSITPAAYGILFNGFCRKFRHMCSDVVRLAAVGETLTEQTRLGSSAVFQSDARCAFVLLGSERSYP